MKQKLQASSVHSHWGEKTNHTRLKHLILEYYLKKWAEILADASFSNRQQDIYYIDGFAGRGVFLDGDKGSPLIAAEKMLWVQKEHNEKYPEKPLRFHIINIENEKANFEMLEDLRVNSSKIVKVQNILGNFKEESKKLIENNRKIMTDAACFWFVDPFWGARDFTFDDVIELMFDQGKPRLRKEVLINFMTYNVVRFLDQDVERPYILKFLGASSVEQVLEDVSLKGVSREEAILSFYKKKLREKGLYVLTQRIQCKDPKEKDADKIYFHMVHCSYNERALIEMRNAFVKVKEKKREFEKALEGDVIDFFDLSLMDYTEVEFSPPQLIRIIADNFGYNHAINLKTLMVFLLQEVSISFEALKDMLHELSEQKILIEQNLDGVKRTKPYNVRYQLWENIIVTLTTKKYVKQDNGGEQLSLF